MFEETDDQLIDQFGLRKNAINIEHISSVENYHIPYEL